jgi:hypothetical protein
VNEKGWTVTCVTTQERIATLAKEADALRMAELLRLHAGACWTLETKEAIMDAFPLWVVPWVNECRAKGSLVSLEEYLEAAKELS